MVLPAWEVTQHHPDWYSERAGTRKASRPLCCERSKACLSRQGLKPGVLLCGSTGCVACSEQSQLSGSTSLSSGKGLWQVWELRSIYLPVLLQVGAVHLSSLVPQCHVSLCSHTLCSLWLQSKCPTSSSQLEYFLYNHLHLLDFRRKHCSL